MADPWPYSIWEWHCNRRRKRCPASGRCGARRVRRTVINDRDGMGYGRGGEPVGGVAVFYDKVCIIFILGRGKRWGVCEGRKCVWHGYFPDLYIFYKYMHSSFTSFTKPHLRCFPLLRSSFLLIRRCSLQRFSQTDFHANLKSACINLCVNCDV